MNQITSVSHQTRYPDFCKYAASNENIYSRFKTFPEYQQILEHVNKDQGQMYYDFCKEHYGENLDKLPLCSINDKQGSPLTQEYAFGKWSPSTLRYFKVALDINHCFGDTKDMNILEIGGGYGGQCAVYDSMFDFKSWTMVDLPQAVELEKKYVAGIETQSDIRFISCYDIKEDDNEYDLVISNYAFSEVVREYQDAYIDTFMSNEEKIYMTVGLRPSPLYGIYDTMYEKDELISRLNLSACDEIPYTGRGNIIVLRGHQREI